MHASNPSPAKLVHLHCMSSLKTNSTSTLVYYKLTMHILFTFRKHVVVSHISIQSSQIIQPENIYIFFPVDLLSMIVINAMIMILYLELVHTYIIEHGD